MQELALASKYLGKKTVSFCNGGVAGTIHNFLWGPIKNNFCAGTETTRSNNTTLPLPPTMTSGAHLPVLFMNDEFGRMIRRNEKIKYICNIPVRILKYRSLKEVRAEAFRIRIF